MRGIICRSTMWAFMAAACWSGSSALATDVDPMDMPSPITAIEEMGESLNSGKDREKSLRAQVKSLTSEIISISTKIRNLRELIQEKEVQIQGTKRDLQEVGVPYRLGEEGILLHEHGLHASIVSLFLARRHAKSYFFEIKTHNRVEMLRLAVLAGMAEGLKRQKDTIAASLKSLKSLRARHFEETNALVESKRMLELQRADLEALLHRKSSLQAIVFSEHKKADEKLARLAAKANDLQQLMEVLESPAKAPEDGALAQETGSNYSPSADLGNKNLALMPTVNSYRDLGQIVSEFGARRGNGLKSQGLHIKIEDISDVVSLRAGKVVFSGTFRTYGLLLIIEHGQGYHSLLSGFGRIYGQVGDFVRAGEPVGLMGDAAGRGSVLYVEVRRKGKPINPTGWLDQIDREVRG